MPMHDKCIALVASSKRMLHAEMTLTLSCSGINQPSLLGEDLEDRDTDWF